MAELKTKPTDMRVADFIAAAPDATRRADAETICAMMERITGDPPVMWGPSIIGFGSYRYKYDSGREGEICRLGFSPRKAELVLYILSGGDEEAALLARLGKHKTGKACLYIRRLADVDMDVLETLVRGAHDRMAMLYPA